MKVTVWIAAAAGVCVLLGLIVLEGAADLSATLAHAGFGLLWLVPLHVLPLALDAQAWNVLLRPCARRTASSALPFLFWIAAVREAVNRLLPTVSIGGEIVGIRLARLRFDDSVVVTATIVVEVFLTVVAQYLFAAAGAVLLLATNQNIGQAWSIGAALLLSLPVPLAFAWVLKNGRVFERLHGFATRLLGQANRLVARLEGARLDQQIRDLLARPRLLSVALAWQFGGFVAGSLETWLALRLLGHPISLPAAIAVEALSQAIRNLIFVVPGGIGVQEGAVMLFARLVGVEGDIALTLALVKRMREILFGLPALVSWQWAEATQLRRASHRLANPIPVAAASGSADR